MYFRYYVSQFHTYYNGPPGNDSAIKPTFSDQAPEDYIKDNCELVYVDSEKKEVHFNYVIRCHEITKEDYEQRNKYSIPLREFRLDVR